MLHIKVGIQLASLKLPFKQALLTAAKLGADGVEIDARGEIKPGDLSRTGVRQIRKMLEDLNLRVCAIGFRTDRGYNVHDNLERRIEGTKQAMKMAYDLGAAIVINQVGRIPEDAADPDWTMLLQVLTDLGRHSQRIGAILAAETGSESGPSLARLIAALPAGSIGVNLDPGNLIINGYSPREAVQSLGPLVRHVHAKDGVRDLAQGRGLEVPLGRGSVDFPELLGMLEEHQYGGYFTIERTNSNQVVAEIGQAVEYLRSL